MPAASHLRDAHSPLRRFLDTRLPNVQVIQDATRPVLGTVPTVRPTITNPPWGTIGTAATYRLGYLLGNAPLTPVAAGAALWLGAEFWDADDLFDADCRGEGPPGPRLSLHGGTLVVPPTERARHFLPLIGEFLQSLESLLRCRPPAPSRLGPVFEHRLCKHCFALALLDEFYREGSVAGSRLHRLQPGDDVGDLLALCNEPTADDLGQLVELAQVPLAETFSAVPAERIHIAPSLAGASLVGGADADFVINGCLVEMKTTVHPAPLQRSWIHQLAAYALLDATDEHALHTVGFYLARQGVLVRWDLTEYLELLAGTPVDLDGLRNDLVAHLRAATLA